MIFSLVAVYILMLTSATRPFTADDGTGKSSRNGLDQLDKDLKVNHAFSFADISLIGSNGWFNGYNEEDDSSTLEDFKIWSAIATSLAKWNEIKKIKEKIKRQNLKIQQYLKHNRISKRHRTRRDEEMVCYRNFGCFRDEGPFDYLDTLPASPEAIGTTFTLHTRKNPIDGDRLDYENSTSLLQSNFNGSNPVKIIIHGFGSSGKRPWVMQMTEALLYADDVNVVVIDWEKGAALPNYVQAAANTQLVGKQIAHFIRMINFENNLSSNDYHLIGFSLGAHVAGFTGMEITNISRITGLDPAAPLFEGYPERVRLDPSDAQFVDVIHSNGDSFLRGGLGSFDPMGHIDFYPNGGRVQVGCSSVFMGAITDIFYGRWQSLCHHRRAFRFFIDSVVPSCKFKSYACDSFEQYIRGDCFDCGPDNTKCSNMGYFAHQSSGRGKMYLVTRENEPFCAANQYKVQVVGTEGQGPTWGRIELVFMSKDANETFTLTSDSDEIKDQGYIQGLVVAHPAVRNVTHAIVKYTKYRGWIYSGKDTWSFDKISLTDSNGETMSYCGFNTILDDAEPVQLELVSGNCTVSIAPQILPTQRLARIIWRVVSGPIRGRPPKLLWRIAINSDDGSGENTSKEEMNYFWQTLRRR